jgi:WS/DGAT/MGAT family acyltransferase
VQTTEQMSPLDSTFLELEQADEGATMHIGGALIFDPLPGGGTPTLRQLEDLLEERFGTLPRFRFRLSEPRVHGLRRPSWVEDPGFAFANHLGRATLPAPGGRAEMHEWLSDFWSHKLDRTRPLWEMTRVDGLEGGRWMLATKTHHSMVDGVSSIDIGHILLDAEPGPGPRRSAEEGPEEDSSPSSGPLSWLSPGAAARIARAGLDVVRHPRKLVGAGEAAVAMGQMVWRDEVNAARPSSLNVPIGTTRRFTSVSLPLDDVKTVKRSLGGTVNDVILALAAGALRRLLLERRDEVEPPLRAMVPVNLRGEDAHDQAGNRVTSLFVELPTGEDDPRRRYERTCEAAERLKSSSAARGGSTLVLLTGLMPPLLHEPISQTLFAPRLFNLTVTNVPGPQYPLYSMGSRMRQIIPLVPLFADHSLGIAIVSYDGTLTFGLNADRAAVPDLPLLERALREELGTLLRLATDTGRTPT